MTKTEAQAARERCEKATPGPWHWGCGRPEVLCADGLLAGDKAVYVNCGRGSGEPSDEDIPFLVQARMDLPAALDMLERAMKLLERLSYVDRESRMAESDAEWRARLDETVLLLAEWHSIKERTTWLVT